MATYPLAAEYARIAELWSRNDWPPHERRGIWLAYEDWLFDECLTMLEAKYGENWRSQR